MKQIVAALVLVLAASSGFGEVGLSLGTRGAVLLPGPDLDGEIGVGASGDLYRPLEAGFALLADAAADVRYLPADSSLVASGEFYGDLSVERGSFLGRLEIGALGETSVSWGATEAAGPAGEVSALLEGSWSGDAATAESAVAIRLLGGSRITWGPSIRLGLSGVLAGRLIMSVGAKCGVDFPATGAVEPVLSGTATAEWLPEAPYVLRAEAAIERRVSSAVESVLVGSATMDVPGYWGYVEARVGLRLDALLGRRANLTLDVPTSYTLCDHGAITASAILPEKEWRVEIEPSLEVALDLSRRLAVSIAIEDRLVLSNAVSMSNRLSAGIEARLTLP